MHACTHQGPTRFLASMHALIHAVLDRKLACHFGIFASDHLPLWQTRFLVVLEPS